MPCCLGFSRLICGSQARWGAPAWVSSAQDCPQVPDDKQLVLSPMVPYGAQHLKAEEEAQAATIYQLAYNHLHCHGQRCVSPSKHRLCWVPATFCSSSSGAADPATLGRCASRAQPARSIRAHVANAHRRMRQTGRKCDMGRSTRQHGCAERS